MNTSRKRLASSLGPAIIVAAVVLGPGSILTSSKVGATLGLMGLPVVFAASVLMIAMVALAARLGAVYDGSIGDELAKRVGRPMTIVVGLVLFVLIALFQSSNNIALIGGLEPLLGEHALNAVSRAAILVVVNGLIVASLYFLRDLYRSVERLMKLLIGLTTCAFLVNFVVAFATPRTFEPVTPSSDVDWLPLLAMIGTTFSVAGAFYQAYLVKEKGWGLNQLRDGFTDSVVGISLLGIVTGVILMTSWRVFYGAPDSVTLSSVGDVAVQLEPLFGSGAKVVFCIGILAGALSSFLVNALIGGTVLSDTLGKGSRLSDRWPLHLTALALLVGATVAGLSLAKEGSTVHLITLAQALTVLGIPALAMALIFLGTRPELTGNRRIPRPILWLAVGGLLVSCLLAYLTAGKVLKKWRSTDQITVRQDFEDCDLVDGAEGCRICADDALAVAVDTFSTTSRF